MERRHERQGFGSEGTRVVRAHDVMGSNVVNRQGESLGTIEDLVFDSVGGRIVYAVLSFGGFMGLGSKLFAIPWPALQFDQARDEFVLDIPRDRLEAAPGFDRDNWPDLANREWQANTYSYYGYRPYWEEGEEYGRRVA